MILKSLDVP